jgi:hypothetical protein
VSSFLSRILHDAPIPEISKPLIRDWNIPKRKRWEEPKKYKQNQGALVKDLRRV